MTSSGATTLVRDVIVEPDPAATLARAKNHFHAIGDQEDALAARANFGVKTSRPIIMTGHQVAWWHAGILAKYMACESLAQCLGGEPVWVTPDQDESDYPAIAIPVRDDDGRLSRSLIPLAPDVQTPRLPAATDGPVAPDALPDTIESALPSVDGGLDRMRSALGSHASAASAAFQVSAALTDLMRPQVKAAPVLFASCFHRNAVFRAFVKRLRDDAPEATRHYNEAVAAVPNARVAPLLRSAARERFELPLWRLEPGKPRRTVYAHEVDDIPAEQLAPKALLFTGFLRSFVCDLFIHGTGGGVYDRVTEVWLRNWLHLELAPVVVVSATVVLPLAHDVPTADAVDQAVWAAHHARHHPNVIGLDALQKERDDLSRAVDEARSAGPARSAAFRALHMWLARYRSEHREALESLRHRADELMQRRADAAIASDRTWPFFFHSPGTLHALADRIDAAVCPAATVA